MNAYEALLDSPKVKAIAEGLSKVERPAWALKWPPDPRRWDGFDNYQYLNETEFQLSLSFTKFNHWPVIRHWEIEDARDESESVGFEGWGKCGVVDFYCEEQEWFCEAKMEASTHELARGLGQCLFYNYLLPRFRGFLVIPNCHRGSIATFERVCWKHNIVLCIEGNIQEEIERSNKGALPKFVENL